MLGSITDWLNRSQACKENNVKAIQEFDQPAKFLHRLIQQRLHKVRTGSLAFCARQILSHGSQCLN